MIKENALDIAVCTDPGIIRSHNEDAVFADARLGLAILPVGGDPTRVLGQVVSGIGFLGAGVILARGDKIMGVTTAAVIWILAAVGALIGAGFLRAGLTATLLTLLVLLGIEGFENIARRRGLRGSGMHGQVDGD